MKEQNKYESLAKEGIGYKLFSVSADKDSLRFASLQYGIRYYNYSKDGYVVFTNTDAMGGFMNMEVFCFWLTKEEAISALVAWVSFRGFNNEVVVKKIQYRRGMGSTITSNFDETPRRVGLCKEFKIIKEEEE